MLRLRPLRFSTLVAVCSLAATVGSFGASLVLLDGLLLNPVRVDQPHRVVDLRGLSTVPGYSWEAWWGQADGLGAVSRYEVREAVVVAPGGHRAVTPIAAVSPTHFEVLRHRPAAGRLLEPGDAATSGPPAAVVSLAFANAHWTTRDAVIGSELSIEGMPFVVVGIVGAGAEFPRGVGAWVQSSDVLTAQTTPQRAGLTWAGTRTAAIGRLAESSSLPAVQQQLDALLQRLNTEISPTVGGLQFGQYTRVVALGDTLSQEPRTAVLAFVGASVVGVLLAALTCGLLVANQQWARQREWAVRQVVGATPADIRREVTRQAAQWAVAAAVVGLAAMHGFLRLVEYIALSSGVFVPPVDHLGWTFAAAAGLAAAAAATLVAVVPTRSSARLPLAPVLSDRRPMSVRGYRAWAVRSGLVGLQACLGILILVGASFATRDLIRQTTFDGGHAPRVDATVLALRVPADEPDAQVDRWNAVWNAAIGVPGVSETVLLTDLPVRPANGFVFLAGQMPPVQVARRFYRGPFDGLLGLATQSGAVPVGQGSDPVVVLSRGAATAITGGSSVPATARFEGPGPSLDVAGVVNDVRFIDSREGEKTAYVPLAVAPSLGVRVRSMSLVVTCQETCDQPTRMAVVSAIAPHAEPLGPAVTLGALYEPAGRPARARAAVANVYAAVALLVVLAGVYTLSGSVVLGSAFEAGMRMALGAQRSDVVLRLLSRVCTPAALGTVCGAVIVLVASEPSLRGGVPAPSATDLTLAAVLLISTSALAALGPAMALVQRPLVALLRRDG